MSNGGRTTFRAGVALLLLLAAACGGGGGGSGTPAVTVLGFLQATLSGAAELSVVDPGARAAFVAELRSDGALQFSFTGDPSWVGTVTGLHVHRGAADENGPIVVNLLGGGATFSLGTATTADTIQVPVALAQEIAADPDAFYVNVHTITAPNGLARGQLGAFAAPQLHAVLRGSEETNVADADARGGVALAFVSPTRIDFVLAMADPAITAVTDAHVHVGGPGVDGSILVDLENAPGVVLDPAAGTITGSVTTSLATITRLLVNPGAFYVNAHTAAAPAGVARGQLRTGTFALSAALSGAEETSVVDPAATGGLTFELESFTRARMILAVPPLLGIDAVLGAHVHAGGSGVDGPIVVDLLAASDLNRSTPSFSAEGTVAITQALFARMLANPGAFYANVHTAAAPAGLARGQLSDEARSFFAQLDGDNEPVVVDPDAAGTLSLVVTTPRDCSFTLAMTRPAVGDVTGLHIHDGPPGVDGPVLIDLLADGTFSVSGGVMTGTATFTGRSFARLLAIAGRFYGNAHTAGAPAGIARGQLVLRSDKEPPANLAYASPVVYMTNVQIPPNVPTSTGGSVANYSVSPPLPAGLALDPVTGIITGKPTTPAPAADYTVTASNGAGSTTAIVNIRVDLSPPAGLAYASPVTYTVGVAIPPNAPTSTGGAISSYSISPALPAGLTISASTGVISGTPTAAAPATDYTVTGTNAAGSTTATVRITVNASLQPPTGLSYPSPNSFPSGYAITPLNPTVGGGPVSSWSVSPALPAGLTLDASTGVISGTPTTVTAQAGYTVTASNAAGSTSFTVQITVTLGAPNCTSYSPSSTLIEYVNQPSAGASIVCNGGGAATSYSISPSLPAGMTFNTSTGAIGGTPTVSSTAKQYTVTASNATGSSQATVTIVVY